MFVLKEVEKTLHNALLITDKVYMLNKKIIIFFKSVCYNVLQILKCKCQSAH